MSLCSPSPVSLAPYLCRPLILASDVSLFDPAPLPGTRSPSPGGSEETMGAWPVGQWEVAGHQSWGVMGDQPGCGRKEKAAGEWCGRLGVGSPVLETEPGFAQAPGTGQAI